MRLKKVFCTTKRTRLHQLSDILTIAILSVIAGGNGWEDMELYGVSKQAWLSTFLALPNGIPSEDTFRRVFERIEPKQFEKCFELWVKQLVNDLGIQVIAIDGKGVNGSYDRQSGSKALHWVSAWATGWLTDTNQQSHCSERFIENARKYKPEILNGIDVAHLGFEMPSLAPDRYWFGAALPRTTSSLCADKT